MARKTNLPKTLILVFPLLLVLLSAQSFSNASQKEIRLEFNPFLDPISMRVSIYPDGNIKVIRYSRPLLSVIGVYKGALSKSEPGSLLDKDCRDSLSEAFRRGRYSGYSDDRAIEGDQFYLSIKSPELNGECYGFVDETPDKVKSLIGRLSGLWKKLEEFPPAEAYVRSRPVEKDRLELLLKEKRVRFVKLQELPDDLQPVLRGAIKVSGDFYEIALKQYERLLGWASHGHEIFVIDSGRGHQLTPFKSQREAAPNRERMKRSFPRRGLKCLPQDHTPL